MPLPRSTLLAISLALLTSTAPAALAAPSDGDAASAFERHTGARLVFTRAALPAGSWYDELPALSATRRQAAARLLLEEARKYPAGYLGAMGLRAIGVFEACVSRHDDGFRAYNERYKGYLYFGVWNGRDAVVACYYNDAQLPLTFHHEVFHHVDATVRSETTRASFDGDDARFRAAIDGTKPWPALSLSAAELRALDAVATGGVLEDAVSDYASKTAGEDQAETARWLMTNLADGLLQAARRPDLAGSQRILHLLGEYASATPNGPGARWFVAAALGRQAAPAEAAAATPDGVSRLERLARNGLDDDGLAEARALLDHFAAGAGARLAPAERARLVRAAAALVPALFRQRTRANADDTRFTVWTDEHYQGGANLALRRDLERYAQDARALRAIAGRAASAVAAQRELLRLVDRYERFIADRWPVSADTAAAFQRARDDIGADLARPPATAPATPRPTAPRPLTNPYLAKVDAAIDDPTVRRNIRAVQPATVKIGGGSGVNLAPSGLVLTNAHVADALHKRWTAIFPDGREYAGVTIAIDANLDLALVRLDGARDLPTAPIAKARPSAGTAVVAIGQPGTRTPQGDPTGYERWHVSTGKLRGFLPNPLGSQSLGGTKHDAWTYWGHSGSPLFDHRGAIVALHNSWDSKTAMRHAVTWEAIDHFLRAHRVPVTRR